MRYPCLVYHSANMDGRRSQAELDEIVRDHFRFDEGRSISPIAGRIPSARIGVELWPGKMLTLPK